MNTAKTIIYTLSLLLIPMMAFSQSGYTLDESSSMVIEGTSTIHDWEATVEEMDVNITLAPEQLGKDAMVSPVESFSLTVPVESIESGKGSMNRKIYGALKEDDHPQITFKMTSSELTGNGTPDAFTLNVTGDLTIAGTTKEVTFPVNATRVNENSFRFEGTYGLNMEDYEVDPPSAMFGTIKSGEEVDIIFNILVNQ